MIENFLRGLLTVSHRSCSRAHLRYAFKTRATFHKLQKLLQTTQFDNGIAVILLDNRLLSFSSNRSLSCCHLVVEGSLITVTFLKINTGEQIVNVTSLERKHCWLIRKNPVGLVAFCFFGIWKWFLKAFIKKLKFF